MKKQVDQKVTVEGSGSVGSITQIMRLGIPMILILAVILIAVTQMTGYDLKPVIDTVLYGATPTPSYPICTVTIGESSCLWINKSANYPNSKRYGCLQDGAKIQVTGIADPYYEISSYGIESVLTYEGGVVVTDVFSDTPASDAGLQYGDIILRINDTAVNEISDLGSYSEKFVGQQIDFLVQRDGQKYTLLITPQEFVLTDRGGYDKPPIGYSYERVYSYDSETNRGYVLASSYNLRDLSPVSYISCPAQLIQPPIP